jgi:hypothetical protein
MLSFVHFATRRSNPTCRAFEASGCIHHNPDLLNAWLAQPAA